MNSFDKILNGVSAMTLAMDAAEVIAAVDIVGILQDIGAMGVK